MGGGGVCIAAADGAVVFEEPNQSSEGDEGLVVVAGAGGAGGGLEEAGVEERLALANQSSTGVATLGGLIWAGGTTGLGWGCARFEEPNQSSAAGVAGLDGAVLGGTGGCTGEGTDGDVDRFALPNQSSDGEGTFVSRFVDGATSREAPRNASLGGAMVGITRVGSIDSGSARSGPLGAMEPCAGRCGV